MTKTNSIEKCNLWNAETFGAYLSLSKRQIFRLHAAAQIPSPLRIGGSVRWNSAEIFAWIAAGCPDRETWETLKMAAQS